MVAITIITVIMGALTALFITVMGSTAHQRSAQAGAQIADSSLDFARGVGAAGAVKWRAASSVQNQFDAAPSAVQPWLTSMTQASDPNAAATDISRAPLPLTEQKTVNNRVYTVNYYVGLCNRQSNGDCTTAAGTVPYVRVVVAVTWTENTCGRSGCRYVTATLLNGNADPIFEFNQAPPQQPKFSPIAAQTGAVGTPVDPLTVTTSAGVPTFTYTAPVAPDGSTSGLPPGLAMSSDGVASGTPTRAGTFTVVVTVFDGFQNTATTTFQWTIYAALQVGAPPADQNGEVGLAVNLKLALPTGGSGLYAFADPTGSLPDGLAVNSGGTIAGTPSRVGTYHVTIMVSDTKSGASAPMSFGWTIAPAPSIASPGNQSGIVGDNVSLTVRASGGSGTLTFSAAGLPSGLTINSSSGVISGTLNKADTSSVTVTVKDRAGVSDSATFTWLVNTALSITSPGTQTTSVNAPVNVPIAASGGVPAYTWAASGLPGGLTVSNSGVITGTPSAASVSTVKITVTDARGTSVSTTFTWNVVTGPTINVPDQGSSTGTYVTLDVSKYIAGGTGGYRSYSASGLPSGLSSGLSISSSSGVVSGTTSNTTKKYTVTVNAKDSSGATATDTFTWWVSGMKLPIGDQVSAPGSAITVSAGGSGGTSYTASGLPSWLALNAATGEFTGTAPSAATKFPVTLTLSDSTGAFVTQPFTWYVTDLAVGHIGNQSTKRNKADSLNLAQFVSGGSHDYTYAISGPAWMSISGSTLNVAAPWSTGSYSITVTVTDTSGAANGASVTTTFSWKITS